MIVEQIVTLEHTVTQGIGYIVSNMGEEKVMLSVTKGKYYNLGEMGGVIWDLLSSPIPVSRLVDTLQTQYDVEQAQCQEQVISFLQQLLEEGLIEINDNN